MEISFFVREYGFQVVGGLLCCLTKTSTFVLDVFSVSFAQMGKHLHLHFEEFGIYG